jgi:8-oxo-dGTP diphosphatase
MNHLLQFPRLGVSACVWRDGKVLIARRSKPPLKGVWSLPGGHVEFGEALRDAARRELMEETGIAADLETIADVAEVVRRDGDEVTAHYAIVCFAGRWRSGQARAGDDAEEVRWATPEELERLPMTEGTPAIIAKAQRLLGY